MEWFEENETHFLHGTSKCDIKDICAIVTKHYINIRDIKIKSWLLYEDSARHLKTLAERKAWAEIQVRLQLTK